MAGSKTKFERYEKMSRVSAETLWLSVKIEQALNNHDLAKGYGDMLIRMYPDHPNTKDYISKRVKPDTALIAGRESAPQNKSGSQPQQQAEQIPDAQERTEKDQEVLAQTQQVSASPDVRVAEQAAELEQIAESVNEPESLEAASLKPEPLTQKP